MSERPPPPGPSAGPPPGPAPVRGPSRRILEALLALLIVFEEWGWAPLERVVARLMRAPGLRTLEAWVARLPPWAALAVFGLPALALLPVKLLALWALGHGHAAVAITVLVVAKLAGTAVVARLYSLTQPALMQLRWFAAAHAHWMAWKTPLLERLRASLVWRQTRALKARWRTRWQALWRRWRSR